jgi:hypothetical protein
LASAAQQATDRAGHPLDYQKIFDQTMTTRNSEKAFVNEIFGKEGPGFFQSNCQTCHVKECQDCHGSKDDTYGKPPSDRCLDCHKGYYVGMEYTGRAPREDHRRYHRGKVFGQETYLSLLPDVHAQAGMQCADCHSMESLIEGKKSSKNCRDCHQPNPGIIEHGIGAHLEKLECYACHSAWAAQEYGTFFIRLNDSSYKEYFRLRSTGSGPYIKSAYLKEQGVPPLGINHRGRVSPIRPQFITYFSDIKDDRPVGKENRLLAARWKAFFPHTVRRGSVMCDGCHANARRFLLDKAEERIYRLSKDGMTLTSFWNQAGQSIVNGSFLPAERFVAMASRKPAYRKAYVKKWKNLHNAVEHSSKP